MQTMWVLCDVYDEASFSKNMITSWLKDSPDYPVKKKFQSWQLVKQVLITVFWNIKNPSLLISSKKVQL